MAKPSLRSPPCRPPPTTSRSHSWRPKEEHRRRAHSQIEYRSHSRAKKMREQMVKSAPSDESHKMNSKMLCQARHRLRCLARADPCRSMTVQPTQGAQVSQASMAVGLVIPVSALPVVLDFLTGSHRKAAATEDPSARDIKIRHL